MLRIQHATALSNSGDINIWCHSYALANLFVTATHHQVALKDDHLL